MTYTSSFQFTHSDMSSGGSRQYSQQDNFEPLFPEEIVVLTEEEQLGKQAFLKDSSDGQK